VSACFTSRHGFHDGVAKYAGINGNSRSHKVPYQCGCRGFGAHWPLSRDCNRQNKNDCLRV
jgi:hypothetical protein